MTIDPFYVKQSCETKLTKNVKSVSHKHMFIIA